MRFIRYPLGLLFLLLAWVAALPYQAITASLWLGVRLEQASCGLRYHTPRNCARCAREVSWDDLPPYVRTLFDADDTTPEWAPTTPPPPTDTTDAAMTPPTDQGATQLELFSVSESETISQN